MKQLSRSIQLTNIYWTWLKAKYQLFLAVWKQRCLVDEIEISKMFHRQNFYRCGWMQICWGTPSNTSTRTCSVEIRSPIQRYLRSFEWNWCFHSTASRHPCILIWQSDKIFHRLDRAWTYNNIQKFWGVSPGLVLQGSNVCTWTPPRSHDREMAAVMDIVRTTGAELAFVSGVSQIALDDDLLRMQSKGVIEHGFLQINNPCKGLGVIHHAAVSVVTGLYIGGHVAVRGESTLDCVKILLQRSMAGVSSESQIKLSGNTFFGIEDMEEPKVK